MVRCIVLFIILLLLLYLVFILSHPNIGKSATKSQGILENLKCLERGLVVIKLYFLKSYRSISTVFLLLINVSYMLMGFYGRAVGKF